MNLVDKYQTPNIKPLTKFRFLALITGTLTLTACSNSTLNDSDTTVPLPPAAHERPLPIAHPEMEAEPIVAEITADTVIEHHLIRPQSSYAHKARQPIGQLQSTPSPQHHPRPPHVPPIDRLVPTPSADGERYPEADDNPVRQVASHPVSTFSIDVDTAAYANARRTINAGQLPQRDAVRVEEFINYFNYNYEQPNRNDGPFSVTTEVGPSPWNADRKLMLVGLQGYDVDRSELPPANLVFLIDVSGSMNSPHKLGLLKSSMKMLTRKLRAEDTISIAVYAGAAGQVLEPTAGNEGSKILAAIDALHAGGSTNGGAGINLAYALAEKAQKEGGINRVILATDGDFNVGASSTDALGKLIEKKRQSGVALTVLGFGAGNYNDAVMQELAQKGNGNAAYIDTLNEARKVLVDEMGSTLETIAKDVKIQVEFNPALVSEYRLIGYETRHLNREDFNNDKVDAGEIGAGHSVTALYELTMTDAAQPSVDPLRYGNEQPKPRIERTAKDRRGTRANELAYVKLRYKAPTGDTSKLIQRVVPASSIKQQMNRTSENYKFATAASAFGQLLRGSNYTGNYSYADALALAQSARGKDAFGYRREFESLLRNTAALQGIDPDAPERISMR